MPDENQPQPYQPPAQPNPERKTLDERAKMTELERIRHSGAHAMATAIVWLGPDAKLVCEPPVGNGFYDDEFNSLARAGHRRRKGRAPRADGSDKESLSR